MRIVLAFASLYYMPLHPRTCTLLYSISCLLDALDGYAARYFEQSTKFGAVLDMVTDRCTTACLLVFLSSAWPRWALLFQGLISLDFASHYVHMFATLAMGGSDTSHKKVDKSRSFILNLYYTNKVCLKPPVLEGSKVTDQVPTDGPLPLLHVQRGLLHCALPTLLLLAPPFAIPPPSLEQQRSSYFPPTRQPLQPIRIPPLRQSQQCRRVGAGAGEQDGLVLAMGHRWYQLPNHVRQASH